MVQALAGNDIVSDQAEYSVNIGGKFILNETTAGDGHPNNHS
jgi:hypothetical protein